MNRFLVLTNILLISILAYLSLRLNYYQKAMSYVFGTPISTSGDCLVSLDYFDFQEMIRFVKSERSTPIIILLFRISPNAAKKFPHLSDYESVNSKVDEINKMLVSYAVANNLKYIDLNPVISKKNRLDERFSDDGLHLNEAGYRIWASKMREVL